MFTYGDTFKNMRSKFCVFHTNRSHESDPYDSWKFTTPDDFDDFWFDQMNSTLLFHAEDFIIGEENI